MFRFYYLKLIKIAVLSAFCFWGLACDAPRENPFDPGASNYQAKIETKIFVHHLSSPFAPIANIQIGEPNLQLFGQSDDQGSVTWRHEFAESLSVAAWGDNYFPNTAIFKPVLNHNQFQLYLNAVPQLQKTKFYSFYENFPKQTYLIFNSEITDIDGTADIDSVQLKEDRYGFSTGLKKSTVLNVYETYFEILAISPELIPQTVPELNFQLIVKNINSDSIQVRPFNIRRVIIANPTLQTPVDNSTVIDSVVFSWAPVKMDFEFTFNISLRRFGATEQTEYKNIPSYQNRLVIFNLTSGHYTAQLQIEDRLGNICGSEVRFFKYVSQ